MTPAVTISAAFRAGSIFDPLDRDGLAYLTGKVIDRGTERRSASVIAEELDSRGVSLKVSTGRPMLTLSCTCLSEDFDDVLAIVADVARRPTFSPDEIEKRRAEVLTTLRQKDDNPASRVIDGVLALLCSAQHPCGRPMKGAAEEWSEPPGPRWSRSMPLESVGGAFARDCRRRRSAARHGARRGNSTAGTASIRMSR